MKIIIEAVTSVEAESAMWRVRRDVFERGMGIKLAPDGAQSGVVLSTPTEGFAAGFLYNSVSAPTQSLTLFNNGQASAINNRGQVAGFAETAVPDSTCPAGVVSKTDSPVVWEGGKAQALSTVAGDPDGQAQGINEQGQVVGYSGDCIRAHHAMLWENGMAFALPGLGPERSNIAWAINNQTEVVYTNARVWTF